MANYCNTNCCNRCGNRFENCCCSKNPCCNKAQCIVCPGQTGRFLTSYIEAQGSTQNVASGGNVVFDIDPEYLDVVGTDITLGADGSTFRFNRTGLYHIEWSLDLSNGTPPIIICVTENGTPVSPMKTELSTGTISSGALIHVDTLPYTLTLNNIGGAIELLDPAGFENTVASIRILRFADAPIA